MGVGERFGAGVSQETKDSKDRLKLQGRQEGDDLSKSSGDEAEILVPREGRLWILQPC